MFDFASTLEEADIALAKGDYALSMFNYWLVNFAFEDEDFPYHYTKEIGEKAEQKFRQILKKHRKDILESDSYLQYKKSLSVFEAYKKYFHYFEQEIINTTDAIKTEL